MKKIIVFLLFPSLLWAAQGIHVSWNPNTESDLAGYKVLYAAPGDPGWAITDGAITYTLGSFPNTSALITTTSYDLLAGSGPYAVAVVAVDTSGNESAPSDVHVINVVDEPAPLVIPPINVAPDKPTQIIINIVK